MTERSRRRAPRRKEDDGREAKTRKGTKKGMFLCGGCNGLALYRVRYVKVYDHDQNKWCRVDQRQSNAGNQEALQRASFSLLSNGALTQWGNRRSRTRRRRRHVRMMKTKLIFLSGLASGWL